MSCALMTIIRLRTNCHMTIYSHVTITICLLMQRNSCFCCAFCGDIAATRQRTVDVCVYARSSLLSMARALDLNSRTWHSTSRDQLNMCGDWRTVNYISCLAYDVSGRTHRNRADPIVALRSAPLRSDGGIL